MKHPGIFSIASSSNFVMPIVVGLGGPTEHHLLSSINLCLETMHTVLIMLVVFVGGESERPSDAIAKENYHLDALCTSLKVLRFNYFRAYSYSTPRVTR